MDMLKKLNGYGETEEAAKCVTAIEFRKNGAFQFETKMAPAPAAPKGPAV